MKIGETKTEKGTRTIQLPPSTVEILKTRKKKSYSEWIFHNPTVPELPLSPETAYRRMKTLLRYAELPPIRFHDLRHPYVKPKTKKYGIIFESFGQRQCCPKLLHTVRIG